MVRSRWSILALAGAAALLPLAPVAAHGLPAAGRVVIQLQVSGTTNYMGTLAGAVKKRDTLCGMGRASKGSKALAYAVTYNFANVMAGGKTKAFAVVLEPYKPAVSQYSGNKEAGVILVVGNKGYSGGGSNSSSSGKTTQARSIVVRLAHGGLSGNVVAQHVPAIDHKGYVNIMASWTCTSLVDPNHMK